MVKSILIIDDDLKDLEKASTILSEKGYSVETASDGAEGIDILSSGKFDFILLDIKMPTLTGYDLLRILREKVNGSIKIAFFSIVPKNDADLTNADGFIQKPFSKESLIKSINEMQ